MGFADLIRDGGGAIKNLVNAFTDDTDHPYPNKIAGKVSNKAVSNDRAWQESRGYGFQVVKVDSSGNLKSLPEWKEFVLQINPQEITQDEIFAIEVTPTFSGVLVEHQGVTLKDIVITGTTGLSPMRSGGGSLPQSGAPISNAGRSGYYEFHELRTYLRSYVEAKRNDQSGGGGELRLIWKNNRDHEDLYVEPQKFTMKRNASKPFLYDYTINLKAIGIAGDIKKDKSWLDYIEDFDRAVTYVQDTLDTATKVIEGSVSFLERVERDILSTVINPLRSVGEFVRATKVARGQVKDQMTRLEINNLKEKLEQVYDNSSDYLGRDVSAYNEAKGRTPTLAGDPRVSSYDESKAIRALQRAVKALSAMLSTNIFFQQTLQRRVDAIEEAFNSADANEKRSSLLNEKATFESDREKALLKGDTKAALSAQEKILDIAKQEAAASGASSVKLKITDATHVGVAIVGADHTIQTLAASLLGNADLYRDLIFVNGLVPPYVDPTGTVVKKGVLRPGDKVFFPQNSAPETETGAIRNVDYPISEDLTEVEKNFGVDLMLDDDYDLIINSSEDAKLIAGTENVAQALILKLYYELGSLKRHPEIGTNLSIGTKSTDLRLVVSQVRASLQTDSRVEHIVYSEFKQEGNAVIINMVLKLAGIDQPINVPVPVEG